MKWEKLDELQVINLPVTKQTKQKAKQSGNEGNSPILKKEWGEGKEILQESAGDVNNTIRTQPKIEVIDITAKSKQPNKPRDLTTPGNSKKITPQGKWLPQFISLNPTNGLISKEKAVKEITTSLPPKATKEIRQIADIVRGERLDFHQFASLCKITQTKKKDYCSAKERRSACPYEDAKKRQIKQNHQNEKNDIEEILIFHHDIAKQVVGQMENFSKEEPNRKIIDKQHFTVIAKYLSHELRRSIRESYQLQNRTIEGMKINDDIAEQIRVTVMSHLDSLPVID